MAFRTIAEVKQFAAQMLSERETDTVLGGSTALGDHNLLERWLQQTFDRFATWGDLRYYEDTIELTWGSGSSSEEGAVLYLPDYVSRILSIYPQESTETVEIIHAAEFDRLRPDIRFRDVLVEWGYYNVERDMAAAGTLTATSASGSSANGLQVRIDGLTNASPGYTQIETVTLAGAGTATTSATFKAGAGGVRSINIVPGTVPTAGTGVVTITGGGGTMERLDANRERMHEHIRTELFAPIGGVGTYKVRYYRRPFNVTTSTDLVPVPEQFSDLMEIGIMKNLERFRGNVGNVTQLEAEWRQRMKEFMGWNNRRPGYRPVLGIASRWSRGMW